MFRRERTGARLEASWGARTWPRPRAWA